MHCWVTQPWLDAAETGLLQQGRTRRLARTRVAGSMIMTRGWGLIMVGRLGPCTSASRMPTRPPICSIPMGTFASEWILLRLCLQSGCAIAVRRTIRLCSVYSSMAVLRHLAAP